MNKELMESMNILEKEYNISKDTLLEAIENSLLTACKNHFGKADNVKVIIDPDGCDYSVYMEKEVVENVEDPITQISLADARMIAPRHVLGDIVQIPIDSHDFGRIATQNAKNVILQKIREESRKSQLSEWQCKEKEVVTGIVQRYIGRNVSVDLGKIDAILPEAEQVKGETFQRTERIKVYILEVKDSPKGPRISVSRTHPDLVRRLFEAEIAEVRDGTVEIRAIAREAGFQNKDRSQLYRSERRSGRRMCRLKRRESQRDRKSSADEKIDIINWDDNPAFLIENALSPAKVISVVADEDEKEAQIIVPDYQLSLAIGKEDRTQDWLQD